MVLRLDDRNNADGAASPRKTSQDVDVAIEFSAPHAVVRNIKTLAAAGRSTWSSALRAGLHSSRVREIVEESRHRLGLEPQFFDRRERLSEAGGGSRAAARESKPQYEAWAWEIHHSAKKDAPSGTLLKLVEEMRKSGWDARSIRLPAGPGAIPGTHEIGFDSARRYNHVAPHRPQSGRFRARRV